jgi:hypothetical protein
MHDTDTIPPFGPTIHVDTLGSAERKRTGHVFKDCPLRDLEPAKKGNKVVACESCRTRWTAHTAEAAIAQRAFDAAWYAQAAVAAGYENPLPPARGPQVERPEPPTLAERVEAKATFDRANALKPSVKPNRFGGKCTDCGQWVEAGAGRLTGSPGQWGTAHVEPCPEATAPAAPAESVTPGMYWDADGDPVKVQVSRTSGKPYAKTVDGEYIGGGKHLVGLVRMTLAEAKAYGRRTGQCCCCGAQLTDPSSVEAGIGPICASKF